MRAHSRLLLLSLHSGVDRGRELDGVACHPNFDLAAQVLVWPEPHQLVDAPKGAPPQSADSEVLTWLAGDETVNIGADVIVVERRVLEAAPARGSGLAAGGP